MLDVKNVSMIFGGLVALNKVNLKVEKGEIRGLIGPNGSGKTTMINVITGFYNPTSGDVTFKDTNISRYTPYNICKKGLVRTFQNINLFPQMTALENVLTGYSSQMKSSLTRTIFNFKSFRQEEKQYRDMADEIIKFVGLSGKENTKACNLPYGQQRLLEIGRALATKPELILLDEPVAGMNDQESDEVAILVKKLQQNDITVLLIEHHMRFVMNLCEKLTVFNSGVVIAEGSPKEIQNNEEVIEVYLGKKGRKDAQH